MISQLNTIKPLKFLWILMALYLLNCSVDTTCLFYSAQENTHLILNDQESIIEIVLEQFLGFENAIPECADNDIDQKANLKKAQLIDIFVIPDLALATHCFSNVIDETKQSEENKHFSKFYFKIPSPPPEV